jgi:hypothetical protein
MLGGNIKEKTARFNQRFFKVDLKCLSLGLDGFFRIG